MFQGSIVALITPFLENGKIDEDSFRKLVHWHIEQGSDALVVCGSTGESSTLRSHEQLHLIEMAVQEAKGRIPIIAGTGSNHTEEAVSRTLAAKKTGADACLIIFPYYNRPVFEGCYAHFEQLALCNLPIILYHHPGRTGLRMNLEQMIALSRISNVVGIKEASADVSFIHELIQSVEVPVYSGDDSLTLPLIACGAKGTISIIGNILPKLWKDCVMAALSGQIVESRQIYKSLSSLCKALVLETNPQCVKYAVSLMGRCKPIYRLPLIPPQDKVKKQIASELIALIQTELVETRL